jgi:hypothetical protein
MVMARFLPSFRLLEIALGNRPVLAAPERVYQRLLSRDVEEAGRLRVRSPAAARAGGGSGRRGRAAHHDG